MNTRRRRSDADRPLGSTSSSSQLSQMFAWSDNPVKVREFVDQRILPVPTIARIDIRRDLHSKWIQSEAIDLHSGSLYLICSMFSQLLVVARNKDNRYWTIPLTSSLKFHLLSESSDHKTCQSAVDPMTLADMLSDADIASIEGNRVRLASSSTSATSKSNMMQGELELVSAYNEKYLLGYAFCGATLTNDVKVLPGYIPLTVQTASRMNNSSSTSSYQEYVNQFSAATESFSQNINVANLLEEITMHDENPNSDYATIDDLDKMQLRTRSNRYIKYKLMTSPNNVTASLTSPTSDSHNYIYGTSTEGQTSRRRPLPPIPRPHPPAAMDRTTVPATWTYHTGNTNRTKLADTTYQQPTVVSRLQSHEIFDETLIAAFKTRRKAAVGVTVSMPAVLQRSESDLTVLDENELSTSTSQRLRLSSLSLENLVQNDQQPSSSSDTDSASLPDSPSRNRSDRGTPQSEAVNGAEEMRRKHHSILRRQRPVTRIRKGEVVKSLAQSKQITMTLPRNYRLSNGRSSTGVDLYENIYEKISSPIYWDMSASSSLTLPRRSPTNKRLPSTLDNLFQHRESSSSGTPSMLSDENSIYEEFRPRISTPDNETYVNLNFAVQSDVIPPSAVVIKSESRSGIVKPRIRITKSEVCKVDDAELHTQQRTHIVVGTRMCEHDSTSGNPTTSPQATDDVDHYEQPRNLRSDTLERFNEPLDDQFQASLRLPGVSPVELGAPELSSTNDEHFSWSTLNDVPQDITTLSVGGVAVCLKLLHLNKYVTKFGEEQIDGDLLTSLDKDVLMEDFGFKRFEAIKLEKFARQGWRPRLKIGPPTSIQISSESYC